MQKKLEEILTPQQAEIAKLRGLRVLISCPGAGKTRIVGARTALLSREAEEQGWAGVAAITFTNAARDEIRKVYYDLTGTNISSPHYIGTIDSFIFRYIFNPFGHFVMGKADQAAELVPPNSNLLDRLFMGKQYQPLYRTTKQKYSYDATGQIRPSSGDPELASAIQGMKGVMKTKNLATIQDAAYFALMTLRSKPILKMLLARRFPFIMIDEAQDCSDVQMAIVDELVAGGHTEIMLIGDPFQAIYQFRDAQPHLLADKPNDKRWVPHKLPVTHRCRPQIVRFLNATVCNKDPAARYMESACEDVDGHVQVIEAQGARACAEAFVALCKNHSIEPSPASAAIIYGAHSSDMSREKVQRIDIQKLFRSEGRELHAALALSQQSILVGRYADALNEAIQLLYRLKFGKSSYQAKRQRLDTEFIEELRPRVWRFCKSLPNVNLSFTHWINNVNEMLKPFLREVHFDDSFQIELSRTIGTKKDVTARTLLIGDGDYATGLPITVENVHQIKGRTFQAVLVYLESGPNKMISGARILKLLSGKQPFAKMRDKDRCVYVAITRAERLLCFAGDVVELKKRLEELKEFPMAVSRSLFNS